MKVVHLLCSGNVGGAEVLCRDYMEHSRLDNCCLIFWEEGPLSREMEEAGQRVTVFSTGPACYGRDLLRFWKLCREEQIDAVICHQSAPLMVLAVWGLKLTCPQVRVLAWAHSNAADWSAESAWRRRLIFCRAERVLCISRSVQESVAERLGFREKLTCLYNGVDIRRFSGGPERDIGKTLELLYVGRLIPEKGVENILRGLLEVTVPFRLRIVGDGPSRRDLETLAKPLGSRVEFLGQRRDTAAFYQKADVFLHLPNWQEGFGLTVVEAMAAGAVPIVNDHGALPELVEDGVSGFVLKPGQSLKAVLEELYICSPGDRETLRENARRRAAEFDIRSYAEKLDALIEELGKRHESGAY